MDKLYFIVIISALQMYVFFLNQSKMTVILLLLLGQIIL